MDAGTGLNVGAPAGLRLIERIGSGGLADVWRAEWAGAPVAVKLLRPAPAPRAGPDARARFLREGRLLRRYPHPGLVRCLAVHDGEPALQILELLDGESLDHALARAPLTEAEATRVAEAVLAALVYLHDVGVVHRDVKPANLQLAEGRVVLLDLGQATDPVDPLASTLGDAHGTHAYAAPETLAGARVDGRADLYALGVTLYEALTGARPYRATDRVGYLQAHRAGRFPSLAERRPGLAPRLAALIERMMQPDPARRPASAAVALATLRAAPVTPRRLDGPVAPIGRQALRGAVLAALHRGGGWVHASGAPGDGLRAATAWARTVAEAEGVDAIAAQGGPDGISAAVAAWVGPSTQVPDALRGLAGEAAGAPRLLLTVEGAPPDGLAELVRAVPGLVVVTAGHAAPGADQTVALRPLREAEVGAVIAAMLDTPAPPAGLPALVLRATGGRAAGVVREVRRLTRAGQLRCEPHRDGVRWTLEPGDAAGVANRTAGDAAGVPSRAEGDAAACTESAGDDAAALAALHRAIRADGRALDFRAAEERLAGRPAHAARAWLALQRGSYHAARAALAQDDGHDAAMFDLADAALRAATGDSAGALHAHLRGAARAHSDAVHAAFHAGMAAALTGDDDALDAHIRALGTPGDDDVAALRAELLHARSARTRRAAHHAEAMAAARHARHHRLLLTLLHERGTAADLAEAAAQVEAVMNALDEPLRADFLTIPAVRWARRAIGRDKR